MKCGFEYLNVNLFINITILIWNVWYIILYAWQFKGNKQKNVCLDLYLLLCDYISRVLKWFTVFDSIEKVPFAILYSSQ